MPNSPIPRSREFWEWKHFKNPFGISPAFVAINDKEIVGLRTFMRWIWGVNGAELTALRAVDTVVHPDYRGKGIFSRLTLLLLEQVQSEGANFIFNTPNKASLPGYLKMGWRRVTRVPVSIRPVHLFRTLSRVIRGGKTTLPEQNKNSIHALFEDPKLDSFLSNIIEKEDGRYRTPRFRDYLKWRYAEIPGFTYGAVWKFGDAASALLVYRQRIRRGRYELTLCEILPVANTAGINLACRLVNELVQNTNPDYILAIAAKDTPENSVLRSSGFRTLPAAGPILTARNLSGLKLKRDPADWSNWRLSVGDLELF
jgi:GNAT superfamily N-acetyltransferase